MKKVLLLLCAVLVSVAFFVGNASAGPSVDQQFTGGTGSLAISSGYRMAQRFLPQMTGLSKVDIELAEVGSNQKVTVAIRHKTGDIWDEVDVAKVSNQIAVNGWNEFDFEDVTVVKDGWYGIFVTADAGPQWKYDDGPSVYSRGYAIWQSIEKIDWDFNFKTWGTDPVEMVAEQDISEQQNSSPDDNSNTNSAVVPIGQSVGTGDAPATTTSALIKPASGLVAAYADGAAKLTWTKSVTTDIDGYKIFRSEEKTKNFTEIGKTIKTSLEYADTKNLIAGKTYYYIVRAYKVKEESVSTTTVELKIPETLVAAPVAETKSRIAPVIASSIDDTDYDEIGLYWILGGVISVLLVLLAAYEIEKMKKGSFVGAKHFRLLK